MTNIDPDGHVCVVGGSLAAATAASAVRSAGHRGRITLISDEDTPPYARPPLSKGVLSGTDSAESALLPSLADVDVILGRAATDLDLGARKLTMADGSRLAFDGLVIATGASACRLGDTSGDVWTLRSMHDANNLREAMRTASTMIMIGGGPLALEIASAAREFGIAVTLISMMLPLQEHVGTHLATVLLQHAQAAGVNVIIDPAGCSLSRSEAGLQAFLSDGLKSMSADLICAAVGCTPNTAWLTGSGLEVGKGGLLVDEYLRAADSVVAAGDVAAVRCPDGNPHHAPLWTNALDQAMLAAANLVGERPQPYRFKPFFWTEVFGRKLKVAGTVRDDAELTVEQRESGTVYQWLSPSGAVQAVATLDVPMSIRRLRNLVTSPAESCRCFTNG